MLELLTIYREKKKKKINRKKYTSRSNSKGVGCDTDSPNLSLYEVLYLNQKNDTIFPIVEIFLRFLEEKITRLPYEVWSFFPIISLWPRKLALRLI